MVCTFNTHRIINLMFNFGEILSTLFSIICIATIYSLDGSIRGIMLSFSVANLVGACMFLFDTISVGCYHDDDQFDFIVILTNVLSLSHLMLLVLDYYIIFTTNSKRKARDFSGLILTSWILSATLGSMNIATRQHEAQMVIIILFILTVLFILRNYLVVVKKNKEYHKLQLTYKAFLRIGFHQNKFRNYWKLSYVAIILFSYIACSVPWLVNEIRAGLQKKPNHLAHSICVLIYSMNFFFPSAICMYMRYKQWTCKRSLYMHSLKQNYSLRFSN